MEDRRRFSGHDHGRGFVEVHYLTQRLVDTTEDCVFGAVCLTLLGGQRDLIF
jgi:hypothetical protein